MLISLTDPTITLYNFSAQSIGDIYQTVKTIITTPAGTLPFDREFGVDHSFLDAPIGIAKVRLIQEYVTKIQRYEPRAGIVTINFTSQSENQLVPEVKIEYVPD